MRSRHRLDSSQLLGPLLLLQDAGFSAEVVTSGRLAALSPPVSATGDREAAAFSLRSSGACGMRSSRGRSP